MDDSGNHDDGVAVWLFDTRPLWSDGIPQHLLDLLKPDEQKAVHRYLRLADKKLCLASYLLKYLAISRFCHLPWRDVVIGRDLNKKPCYVAPREQAAAAAAAPTVFFNVSHQAGIVALAASRCVEVGVDVVCVGERGEVDKAGEDGFEAWVEVYADVFSAAEMAEMKDNVRHLLGRDDVSKRDVLEAKMRRFYAHWALKEAYIKMTGEALLADWLKDLEFRNVSVPRPIASNDAQDQQPNVALAFINGKARSDVEMSILSFEESYMIAVAFQKSSTNETSLKPTQLLNLDTDILSATNPIRSFITS